MISRRPIFSTGTANRSRSACTLSGKQRLHLPSGRLLRQPRRHGDGVGAAKRQKLRRRDRTRFDLQIKLHPGALVVVPRRATKYTRARKLADIRGGLEVVARQFVVVHETGVVPATFRSRLTARATVATAMSMSSSVVVLPKPKRRLLSLRRSLRPKARNT